MVLHQGPARGRVLVSRTPIWSGGGVGWRGVLSAGDERCVLQAFARSRLLCEIQEEVLIGVMLDVLEVDNFLDERTEQVVNNSWRGSACRHGVQYAGVG
eukprot:1160545-Pelagomonas_calceolata.AAC.16